MKIQLLIFCSCIYFCSVLWSQLKPSELPVTTANEIKRDPFRLPDYLAQKLRKASEPLLSAFADSRNRIDDSIDPIRRWALSTYLLVGIIWDVKNPKALVADQQRKVHLVHVNDKIGNQGGTITSIREGSIVVFQDKTPQVISLKK